MKRITQKRKEELSAFLESLDIYPESLSLINQAFIHKSYSYENECGKDNERLEFLGDSVIGFVVSNYLYRRNLRLSEGELSKIKSVIVSRSYLADRSRELGLGKYVLLGKGEENTGGRDRDSLIGSVLEAFVGALYLELGIEITRKFIEKYILKLKTTSIEESESWDFKSQLQEYAQKQFRVSPQYKKMSETGPEHEKEFVYAVYINDKKYAEGKGRRKKIAENLAAKKALEKLLKKE